MMRALRPGFVDLDARVLLSSRCGDCGATHFPSLPACPDCHGSNVVAAALPSRGVVYSFTVVRGMPSRLEEQPPYAIGYVRLSEPSVCLFGPFRGIDLDTIAIGLPVSIVVERMFTDASGDAVMGFCFRPAAEEQHG